MSGDERFDNRRRSRERLRAAFARPDGRVQLAYKGMALYDYAGDTSPLVSAGDNIDEFGGVWRVARPQ